VSGTGVPSGICTFTTRVTTLGVLEVVMEIAVPDRETTVVSDAASR
jgi:hypothetical protein